VTNHDGRGSSVIHQPGRSAPGDQGLLVSAYGLLILLDTDIVGRGFVSGHIGTEIN